MKERWRRWDDWPCASQLALYEALRSCPGGANLPEPEIDGWARALALVAELGRGRELPRFRGASQVATDRQLARLHELADKLAQHIERLNRPALGALRAEGSNAIDFLGQVREFRESARHARSEGPSAEGSGGGRPRKIEAAEVARQAAEIFEAISGRRATFTTDPVTSAVLGDWPRFLQSVFKALHIEASVASQVRGALSEETPPEPGA